MRTSSKISLSFLTPHVHLFFVPKRSKKKPRDNPRPCLCAQQDLNLRPMDYESTALTN